MQYNIRRCRPIRQLKYQTRQCNTGQYNAILDKTIGIHLNTVLDHSIKYRQYITIPDNTMPDNTRQYQARQ